MRFPKILAHYLGLARQLFATILLLPYRFEPRHGHFERVPPNSPGTLGALALQPFCTISTLHRRLVVHRDHYRTSILSCAVPFQIPAQLQLSNPQALRRIQLVPLAEGQTMTLCLVKPFALQ